MARSGGGRPLVEHALTLDLAWLRKQGLLAPGEHSATSTWTWGTAGRLIGQASYRLHLTEPDEPGSHLRFDRIVRMDVYGRPVSRPSHTVVMEREAMPFGGYRWRFVCPLTGLRVSRLHLPADASRFASRQAYRLGYAVQREGPRDRAYRRARKARDRIGGSANMMEKLPWKPKGMHWRTYWRHVQACRRTEAQVTGFLAAGLDRISPGWRKDTDET